MKATRDAHTTPMWPTALALGGFAAVRSFGPSLYARPRGLQVMETALAAGMGIGAGFLAEHVVHTVSENSSLTERQSRAAVIIGGGVASFALGVVAHRSGGLPNRLLPQALSTGFGIAAVGAALGGATSLALNTGKQPDAKIKHKSFEDRLPIILAIAGVTAIGLAVGSWYLKKKMTGMQTPMPKIPQVDDAASLIKRSSLDIAQLRFVDTIPKDLPTTPIRVGAGLQTASSPKARAQLAVQEAVRQGMLERSAILVDATTGGGHVNPTSVEAFERLFGGDTGTIAVQYGNMPSAFALQRIPVAHNTHEEVLKALKSEIDKLPTAAAKPKVFVFGESLGAWGSQDAFVGGPHRLTELGVDKAVWVGVPGYSRWNVIADGGATAIQASKVEEIRALDTSTLSSLREFSFSNPEDPVHRASHRLLFEHPDWLGKIHAEGVPAKQKYTPGVTFLQSVGDVIASRDNTTAGQFTRVGHDYRLDVAELMRDAFGLRDKVDDGALSTINETLKQRDIAVKAMVW